MNFKKVTIVGTGLLGGSLARDLRALGLCQSITGVCRSESTAKRVLEDAVVDQVLPIREAVLEADLIVFATPMQAMLPLLEQVKDCIPASAVITDVGSVKQSLYEELKTHCPMLLPQFVLAHPIAGGEHAGIAASKLGLFKGKDVVITQTDELNAEFATSISQLWQQVGANVVRMSLLEHDAIFAKTSHLPHVIAFSLVNFLSDQPDRDRLFDMAAAGFYDFTRIASSNAQMWRDICITNQQQLLSALDGYREQIDVIRDCVANGDQQGIYDYFDAAKTARDDGLDKKNALSQQPPVVEKNS